MIWSKTMLFGLCILSLATCCLGWPVEPKYRRTYTSYDDDYAIPLMAGGDPYELVANGNNWDFAQEPEYTEPEMDYYEPRNRQSFPLNPEIEALANLLYDTRKDDEVWGQIIRERPETELEELKELSKSRMEMDKRGGSSGFSSSTTTSVAPPLNQKKVKPSPTSVVIKTFELDPKSNMVPSYPGQKEVPLLRPPVQAKAQEQAAPLIKQRSLGSEKKPSPYDTLRKYLSLEDALKKEAEKRAGTGISPVKRSLFISDTDSLTGQLNKLKIPAS